MSTNDFDLPPDVDEDDPRADWLYDSSYDWFESWLRHVKGGDRFSREQRWCAQWWRHDEVVIRIEELWKGWEAARLSEDPAALSGWWVYHLDAHWRHIVAEAGPLHLCTTQQHTQATQRSLAAIPVPPGWFDPPSIEPDSSAEAVA